MYFAHIQWLMERDRTKGKGYSCRNRERMFYESNESMSHESMRLTVNTGITY